MDDGALSLFISAWWRRPFREEGSHQRGQKNALFEYLVACVDYRLATCNRQTLASSTRVRVAYAMSPVVLESPSIHSQFNNPQMHNPPPPPPPQPPQQQGPEHAFGPQPPSPSQQFLKENIFHHHRPSQDSQGHNTPPPSSPNGQPTPSVQVCANCGTSSTPLWRRDGDGNAICNACGKPASLYLPSARTPLAYRVAFISMLLYHDRQWLMSCPPVLRPFSRLLFI